MSPTILSRSALLLVALAGCKTATTPTPTAAAPATAEDAQVDPLSPEGIEAGVEAALDREADPCVDFYQFACGGWLDSAEIPSDRPRWSRGFSELFEKNQAVVRDIVESTLDDGDSRLGQFYGACMDTEAIEAAGAAPLKPAIGRIKQIGSPKSLMEALGSLPMQSAFFDGFVDADFKDPTVNTLHVSQGGLGLPERGYYFAEEGSDKAAILADYEAYLGELLTLVGQDPSRAADVVALETRLAEVSKAPAELRDVMKLYHKLDREGLAELTPGLPWDAFFEAAGAPDLTSINVMTPDFFPRVAEIAAEGDWETIQAYLTTRLIDASAPYLAPSFEKAHFAFHSTRMNGTKEMQPRWKRCVTRTDGAVGDLLGQAYVDRAFAGDSKDKALSMIRDIETAFEAGLPGLAWMDEGTRQAAIDKLHTITNKIGYPDKWETYEGVTFGNGHFADMVAISQWQVAKDLAEVGQPVDKAKWYMTPPTVNAYYNPTANEIVFPAGILQPPFFSASFPTAMNYGAMGMIMGHEVTHGFDDEGRKFAPDGSLQEWWAAEVSERFEGRAECVVDLYDSMELQPDQFVNGELTLGENIADMGGIRLAHRAYTDWTAAGGEDTPVAGFTGEQLLFVAYAQGWCTLATPEYERMRLATDPHSPPKFRVNVPLSQLPAFGEAFDCEVGSPMRPEEVCEVW